MNLPFSIDVETIWNDYLLPYSSQILLAVIIFVVGRILVKLFVRALKKVMSRSQLDPMLAGFVQTIAGNILLLLVIVAALSQLGLDTTSLVALVGAAGLAVGLALKDSLSHFAAGVMLIIFRPFKVGDFVEVDGESGTVETITLMTSRLKTGDNKAVIIPNSNVLSGTIINYSDQATRRIDLIVGIGYTSDLQKAKQILQEMVNQHPLIHDEPVPRVAVHELADSSVNFIVRPWVDSKDYWPVRWELTEAIKLKFDEAGIEIPFPQMDVHLQQN